MSDKEKIAMLVGFLKGTIGNANYVTSIDVIAAKEIIEIVMKDS